MIDLPGYLARIGVQSAPRPDLRSLEALHVAHVGAIPFENLDVRLGRPIRLDAEGLEDKLVGRRRGGYCFEQNTLFASALRSLDFDVDTLEARVRPPGATAPLPRTHMALLVRVGGDRWLADVGFGGAGPLRPVPLDGTVSEQPEGGYVVVEERGGVRVLRRREASGWRDLYAFSLHPALPVDFEVANYFTSTHPRSPFVTGLTVQRSLPSARLVLRGRTLRTTAQGEETVREITIAELPGLLRETFGLDVTDEEAMSALGDD